MNIFSFIINTLSFKFNNSFIDLLKIIIFDNNFGTI